MVAMGVLVGSVACRVRVVGVVWVRVMWRWVAPVVWMVVLVKVKGRWGWGVGLVRSAGWSAASRSAGWMV